MTLTERLKDVQKRLGYMGEIKNLRPEDYQAVLIRIIRDSRHDGIEEEREACAMIADEMKAELSQRPEKLQYGRTQIEVAEYIGQQIRARSS